MVQPASWKMSSGRHAVGRLQGFHSIRVLGAAPTIYAQGEAAAAKCEAQRGNSEGSGEIGWLCCLMLYQCYVYLGIIENFNSDICLDSISL